MVNIRQPSHTADSDWNPNEAKDLFCLVTKLLGWQAKAGSRIVSEEEVEDGKG